MPNFLRTLSHRFVRRPRGRLAEDVGPKKDHDEGHASGVVKGGIPPQQSSSTKNSSQVGGSAESTGPNCLSCKVLLLDSTDVSLSVHRNCSGQELIDRVFESLQLFDERDYFGLQFLDHYHVHHWLDPRKKIQKQMPMGPPYTFRLRVKFYSTEPGQLRDEMTRYQFFLQLKIDIQTGRLECPLSTATELAALAFQSEFGDYNPQEHTELFVSEFRFHPCQDASMERAILAAYRSTLCHGLSPMQAEVAYLEVAKSLDFYGVDVHTVDGKDGNEYRLGLTPHGMLVFDGNQKIGQFLWQKIQRLDFHDRKLTLAVEEEMLRGDGSVEQIQLHTFVFDLTSAQASKHLWKCAIEFHTFFRLKSISQQRPARTQLFRLGSTFRYRGRTEYENTRANSSQANGKSRERRIERKPSQRFAPRHRCAMKDTTQQPSSPKINNRRSDADEDGKTRRDPLTIRDGYACKPPSSNVVSVANDYPDSGQVAAGHITLIRIERNDEGTRENVWNKTPEHSHTYSTSTSRIPKYLQHKSERTDARQLDPHSSTGKATSMENAGFCGDSSEDDSEPKSQPCYNTNGTSGQRGEELGLRQPSASSKRDLPRDQTGHMQEFQSQTSQLRRNADKRNHIPAANTHFSCLPVSTARSQPPGKTSHFVPKSTRQAAN